MLHPADQARIDAFDKAAAAREALADPDGVIRPRWTQPKAGRNQQADTVQYTGEQIGLVR